MTPQSNLMVLAPIAADRIDDLRQLLASMNRSPGVVDPQNTLVPFGQFDTLHFGRILILDDLTLADITAYGLPVVNYPTYLAFLADFDGPSETFFAELMQRAGDGLKRIFSHCTDFDPNADLLAWMKAHNLTPATAYVNWIGRTVRQVREEAALHDALVSWSQQNAAALAAMPPAQLHGVLKQLCSRRTAGGAADAHSPGSDAAGLVDRQCHSPAGRTAVASAAGSVPADLLADLLRSASPP